MGQTWNEFRRQCGLVAHFCGFRRKRKMDHKPLTAESLRQLSIQLFKENYLREDDDDPRQWAILLIELGSIDVHTKKDVLGLLKKHVNTVKTEDRQKARLQAALPNREIARLRQLESGHYFGAVGIVRKCYYIQKWVKGNK